LVRKFAPGSNKNVEGPITATGLPGQEEQLREEDLAAEAARMDTLGGQAIPLSDTSLILGIGYIWQRVQTALGYYLMFNRTAYAEKKTQHNSRIMRSHGDNYPGVFCD
jgi:hypothetical protein